MPGLPALIEEAHQRLDRVTDAFLSLVLELAFGRRRLAEPKGAVNVVQGPCQRIQAPHTRHDLTFENIVLQDFLQVGNGERFSTRPEAHPRPLAMLDLRAGGGWPRHVPDDGGLCRI